MRVSYRYGLWTAEWEKEDPYIQPSRKRVQTALAESIRHSLSFPGAQGVATVSSFGAELLDAISRGFPNCQLSENLIKESAGLSSGLSILSLSP